LRQAARVASAPAQTPFALLLGRPDPGRHRETAQRSVRKVERTAVSLDDILGDREPQTVAVGLLLETRAPLSQTFELVFFHPRTVVFDDDDHAIG
jgi:hypothetical protein